MANAKRWYIFLTSAIALNSFTWAAISLLRNLFGGQINTDLTLLAFQIAVIVIGLPVYLIHWVWAQRLAQNSKEERGAVLRRVYLYGVLAGAFAPLWANLYTLVADGILERIPGTFVHSLVAVLVLAVMYAYHDFILRADAAVVPETGQNGVVRRVYVLGFSAAGLTITAYSAAALLRWLFNLTTPKGALFIGGDSLTYDSTSLLLAVLIWAAFWTWAQRLFASSEEERRSTLRKVYLYLVLFLAVVITVSTATAVLAGLLRRLLGVASPGGDIRQALSIMLSLGVVWAYHANVLRKEAAAAAEVSRQAAVRRIYLYLVAAIGLAAFLIGLAGDLNVLIRGVTAGGQIVASNLRDQFASFTAAIIAGLPVWALPWRAAQSEATASGAQGADARRSIPRRVYLYLYLFAATMTVLGTLVSIVYQVLLLALGERTGGTLLTDLASAIAYGLIGGAVLYFHSRMLGEDGRRSDAEMAKKLSALKLAVVDGGSGSFGAALLGALRAEFPGLKPAAIGLTKESSKAMKGALTETKAVTYLKSAGFVVGSWEAARSGSAIARAVVASKARKLLVPFSGEGVDWAGVDRMGQDDWVEQTVRAVKQALAGEEVSGGRGIGCGTVIVVLVGLVFLFIGISTLVDVLRF